MRIKLCEICGPDIDCLLGYGFSAIANDNAFVTIANRVPIQIKQLCVGSSFGMGSIDSVGSGHADADVLREVEAVPLVVNSNDLALHGVALLVAEFAEEVAVESPFESEGILGEDEVFVICVATNPLTIDLHLSTGNVEHEAVIVAFAESGGLAPTNRNWQVKWHEVLQEETGRIDELKRLSLSV